MSYEVSDFNKEVIEESRSRPVLVDFWAPWCGPCRTLSPILEKLAGEAEGRWSLVTVNSDEHPELSMSYGIRGIPAVKLFSDGEVIAEFTGALPEYSVRQWLVTSIPSSAEKSMAVVNGLIGEGRVTEAIAMLEELQDEPEARLALASILALAEPERALGLVSSVTPSGAAGELTKKAVETVAAEMVGKDEDLPDGPGRTDYQQALRDLRAGNIRAAVERLLQVLVKDRYYGDDAARKLGVAVFTLLGNGHPITRDLRRTFDMYLY